MHSAWIILHSDNACSLTLALPRRVWDIDEPGWPIHQTLVNNPGWVTALCWVDCPDMAKPRGVKWGIKAGGKRRTRPGLELLPGIAFSIDTGAIGVILSTLKPKL